MMNDEKYFEQKVLELARHIWPSSSYYGGSSIRGGRERDGIFETEEMIHLIEVTTSRSKKKAETDIRKLSQLAQNLIKSNPTKGVKGWFITRHEPTAEQRDVARKTNGLVVAMSFMQFQSRLIDANSYLQARIDAPFGSVRDPGTGDTKVNLAYVPLDIVDLNDKETIWDLNKITELLLTGQRFTLLGDFGAGKSTTLREIFLRLKRKYYNGKIVVFPVFLNLRDHAGQTDPSEALERHAKRIGFNTPHHLIRAWRAGYTVLILDGFDELAIAGWTGTIKKLNQIRFRSMELIRNFIKETPQKTGIIISGREHYFDNHKERITALGTQNFTELTLNEFSDEQMKRYLNQFGWDKGSIPVWLPSRPLLLGYLVSRNLLRPILENNHQQFISPARGWDHLLTLICEREASIEVGIDASTVRRILERLATYARNGTDGLGPLSQSAIVSTFKEIAGYDPDDRGMILLQRLPGLGVHEPDDGSRRFIDTTLVDVARAGDVKNFIQHPYDISFKPADWNFTMDETGIEVCALQFKDNKKATGLINRSFELAISQNWDILASDIFRVLLSLNYEYRGVNATIENVFINYLYLGKMEQDYSSIHFRNCYFRQLELGETDDNRLPRFEQCYFGEIIGRVSIHDLPKAFDRNTCVIEKFDQDPATTKAILELSLPLRTRVLLTILKKLYLQRGRGRRENALIRGLDHREREIVPELLSILQNQGLAYKTQAGGNTIWLPAREYQGRIRKLLSSPNTSNDPLLDL